MQRCPHTRAGGALFPAIQEQDRNYLPPQMARGRKILTWYVASIRYETNGDNVSTPASDQVVVTPRWGVRTNAQLNMSAPVPPLLRRVSPLGVFRFVPSHRL